VLPLYTACILSSALYFFYKISIPYKKKKMLVLRAIGYEIQFQRRKLLVEMCCFMRPISIDSQKGKQVVEVKFDD